MTSSPASPSTPFSFPLDPARLPDFPVRQALPAIRQALKDQGLLILGAATGAGKSTLVPPALRGLEWLGDKRILVIQPQRLSTWAIAQRIGSLCGLDFGPELGMSTGRMSRGSSQARIQVMTSGVLLRQLQDDPELQGVGCIIFDEFHQRAWQTDLCLSFSLETREVFRPDLRILVMSATLNAQALRTLMPQAAELDVPGTLHPVQTTYRPPRPESSWWKSAPAFWDYTASQLIQEFQADPGSNLLCFLPGMGEIRKVRSRLEESGIIQAQSIHELHSTTPDEVQSRALSAPPEGQIFLASNIAETGLTLPGITCVVDPGLTRLEYFDARLGMNSLQTQRVSLDSSLQRQGRAGRTGPGRCIKLWPVEEALETQRTPDILRSDLSSFVLESALWGSTSVNSLRLADRPSRSLWNQGVECLRSLDALRLQENPATTGPRDYLEAGSATPRARAMASLGLHPRIAAAALAAKEQGPQEAAWVLALGSFLEYRSIHPGTPGSPAQASAYTAGRSGPGAIHGGTDVIPVLDSLFSRSSQGEVWDHYRKAWNRLMGSTNGAVPPPPHSSQVDQGELCRSLHPEWTGQLLSRERNQALYLLAQGRQAALKLADNQEAPRWIAGLELDTGSLQSSIRLYAPLDEAWYRRFLESCTETLQVEWQSDLVCRAVQRRGYQGLTFTQTPLPSVLKDPLASALTQEIRQSFTRRLQDKGMDILPWTEESRQFMLRLCLALKGGLFALRPDQPPPEDIQAAQALVEDTITQGIAAWLSPQTGKPILDASALSQFLHNLLDHRHKSLMDSKVPQEFSPPGKRSRPVDYSGVDQGQAPQVSLRLQDAFVIPGHPSVLGQPILFHLLSPAGRPVQSTSDLPGFWKGSYQEVRKEMRGRYPKHDWPEAPGTSF